MGNEKRAFLHAHQFDDIWTKLGLDDEDLRDLQNEIIRNNNVGKVMQGTGGFRKMRFGRKCGGKSSGFRVIYMDLSAYSFVYLLMVYPKTEKGNITAAEKNSLRSISKAMTDIFRKHEVKW